MFLGQQKIPFFGINIGTVRKKDIVKTKAMKNCASELGVILAFDVKVTPEIRLLANANGIIILNEKINSCFFFETMKYINQLAIDNKERNTGQ